MRPKNRSYMARYAVSGMIARRTSNPLARYGLPQDRKANAKARAVQAATIKVCAESQATILRRWNPAARPMTNSTCHTSRGNESSNCDGRIRKRVTVPSAYTASDAASTHRALPRFRAARITGLASSSTTYRPITLNCHGPNWSSRMAGRTCGGTGNWNSVSMPA